MMFLSGILGALRSMQWLAVVGLIAGTLLLCGIVYLVEKKRRGSSYDERQQIARGKAMTLAFFVGLTYYLLIAMLDMTEMAPNVALHLLLGFGMILQFLVMHTYCVFADAHLALHEKPVWTAIAYFVIGAMQLYAFGTLSRGTQLSFVGEEAKVWWSLLAGISFLYVGVLHVLGYFLRSRAKSESE